MRILFSALGLLLVLLVVGQLAKKQLQPSLAAPTAAASAQHIQQQIQRNVDAVLQQPRTEPDDKP